jgi:cyclophilin family peptidyl-prolyl cis-trans isomerase
MKRSVYTILILAVVLAISIVVYANLKGAGNIKNEEVLIKTSMGDIVVQLYSDKAPITVKNFLDYINEGFYNGTIFHRVIDGFVIQGGGFEPGMVEKPTKAPIKNEASNGLSNERGTIAMARTQVVDSATSQFFINLKDNTFLDHKDNTPQGYGYCVFGKVIKGMYVVDNIAKVKTHNVGYFQDVPVKDVVIEDVQVIK